MRAIKSNLSYLSVNLKSFNQSITICDNIMSDHKFKFSSTLSIFTMHTLKCNQAARVKIKVWTREATKKTAIIKKRVNNTANILL